MAENSEASAKAQAETQARAAVEETQSGVIKDTAVTETKTSIERESVSEKLTEFYTNSIDAETSFNAEIVIDDDIIDSLNSIESGLGAIGMLLAFIVGILFANIMWKKGGG